MKKSLMSLVVIFFNLNSLKISYANGHVSVRFFTKIIQSLSVYLRYLRYLFLFLLLVWGAPQVSPMSPCSRICIFPNSFIVFV